MESERCAEHTVAAVVPDGCDGERREERPAGTPDATSELVRTLRASKRKGIGNVRSAGGARCP